MTFISVHVKIPVMSKIRYWDSSSQSCLLKEKVWITEHMIFLQILNLILKGNFFICTVFSEESYLIAWIFLVLLLLTNLQISSSLAKILVSAWRILCFFLANMVHGKYSHCLLKGKHEASKIKTANLHTYLNFKIIIYFSYRLKDPSDKRTSWLKKKILSV